MAMLLAATIAWSFAGLFTRSLTLDACTAVAWRSCAGGLLLLAVRLSQRRFGVFRDLATLRWYDWAAVVVGIVAQGAYSACLFLTSVAHVAVIYAATPFVAALLAWWWLGERMSAATLAAVLVSMAGIVVVVAGSGGGGGLSGDALALVMTVAFAALIVLSKAFADLRVAETIMISALLTFVLLLPFSRMDGLDLRNGTLVGVYGAINLVLAYVLFMRGARLVPAATAGLIATLEIVLSPLWVWLVMGETVDRWTLWGGGIVFGAVVGHLVYDARRASTLRVPRSRTRLNATPQT